MSKLNIDDLVSAFDTGGIERVAHLAERAYGAGEIDVLVAALADREASVPASWLLLSLMRDGGALTRAQAAALVRLLPRVRANDARLHLCQSVAHLEVPKRSAEPLARFLRNAATDEHKFLRAWAVDGLYRLAQMHSEYRRESRDLLDRASRDPAASVRARVRRIVREAGY